MTATDEVTVQGPVQADVREGEYGANVLRVEPGGAERVPDADRHGRPLDLLWTWISPNLEFATVFVGVIPVLYFGQSFLQGLAAILVGTALGSLTHGVLSARGARFGVPQMLLSRIGFGQLGNILPAGLNAVTAGIGWFAVNSVSGALALNTLWHIPKVLALLIVVALQLLIAFFGHNLIQIFERYAFPVLAAVFIIGGLFIASRAQPSTIHAHGGTGGFLLTVGASFGYAAGWNPYASDYTRYLPKASSRWRTGLFAGLGVFLSCAVLELFGLASQAVPGAAKQSGTVTANFVAHQNMPTGIGDLTLLAIAVGAVAANVLNIYSGALSFLALGIKLPLALRRALVAVVFGTIGFILAIFGLHNAGEKYNNFLLVIAYWIGPWLGVYFTDQILRRRQQVESMIFDRKHNPFAGVIAMAIGMAVSIFFFSDQTEYTGPVPKHHPAFGDFTFEVGFVLSAVIYAILFFATGSRSEQGKVIVLPD